MSIVDRTDASQMESIAFEFELRHAPEKVWRAITEPALLSRWLLPIAEMKLEKGAAFTFRAPPQQGWDGVVNCRFVEMEQQKRLVYRWVVGDLDTVVTFTLTPTASGTRLGVVQAGFKPEQKQNAAGARYGWRMMGGKLIETLDAV